MKKTTIYGIIILVAVAMGSMTFEILKGPQSLVSGFDRSMQRSYDELQLGSNRDTALEVLGKPIEITQTFNLPQKQGFEHYFDSAERSHAVDYLLWINGSNWFYCIGFDKSGNAVVKGEGHS